MVKTDSRGVEYDDSYQYMSNPETGVVFQVLARNPDGSMAVDENGNVIGWDEAATQRLIAAYEQTAV